MSRSIQPFPDSPLFQRTKAAHAQSHPCPNAGLVSMIAAAHSKATTATALVCRHADTSRCPTKGRPTGRDNQTSPRRMNSWQRPLPGRAPSTLAETVRPSPWSGFCIQTNHRPFSLTTHSQTPYSISPHALHRPPLPNPPPNPPDQVEVELSEILPRMSSSRPAPSPRSPAATRFPSLTSPNCSKSRRPRPRSTRIRTLNSSRTDAVLAEARLTAVRTPSAAARNRHRPNHPPPRRHRDPPPSHPPYPALPISSAHRRHPARPSPLPQTQPTHPSRPRLRPLVRVDPPPPNPPRAGPPESRRRPQSSSPKFRPIPQGRLAHELATAPAAPIEADYSAGPDARDESNEPATLSFLAPPDQPAKHIAPAALASIDHKENPSEPLGQSRQPDHCAGFAEPAFHHDTAPAAFLPSRLRPLNSRAPPRRPAYPARAAA